MAKLINPLLSVDASGQFGKAMVFQKGQRVRAYVIPSNPKTVNQMVVRNKLGDIQRELKLLGSVLRVELKGGFGARWNSMILKELTANAGAALTSYTAEYAAFSSGEKSAWAGADGATPVTEAKGTLLYACASAVYDMSIRLGVVLSLTQPAAANAVTVGGEWTDNTP